jgi:hypothetical protein
MVAGPAAMPVTSPEDEFIVATALSEEVQVPPVTLEVKVGVSPSQIF